MVWEEYFYFNKRGAFTGQVLSHNEHRAFYVSNSSQYVSTIADLQMWIGVASTDFYWLAILDYLGLETIDEFKAWLDENPVYTIYATSNPITTHYTPEETAVILQTYKPITNVFNDQNAFMQIIYAADHKAYIDKKFAMLEQLIGG